MSENAPYRGYRPFLLGILFFSLCLAYLIFRPFLHTVILAVVLASLFHPLQQRTVALYGGRRNAAAFTMVVLITFLIILPVLSFLSALVAQGIQSVDRVTEWINAGHLQELLAHPRVAASGEWLRQHAGFLDISKVDIQGTLLTLSKNFGQFLLSRAAGLLKDVAGIVAHFFVMLFLVFYMIRDGRDLIAAVKHVSPLRDEQEDRILDRVRVVARSALLGNFATAFCQGLVGGIGLTIVGIPGLFWGAMMGFSSLVPVIGTALIWVPAVGYLLILGKWKTALFLAAWCIVLVGSIDNFLRPLFMRGQGDMSPFFIFLAIIGGVQYFGLAGVLYGPLILGFASVMLYIYQAEYQDVLAGKKGAA
jgi:predicted PurR-regulated permease PerM